MKNGSRNFNFSLYHFESFGRCGLMVNEHVCVEVAQNQLSIEKINPNDSFKARVGGLQKIPLIDFFSLSMCQIDLVDKKKMF